MSSAATQPARLSIGQSIMINWFFSVIVGGVVLPIALVAGFLTLEGRSPAGAIDYGGLFLAGGNALVNGCAVLLASRLDKLVNVVIVVLLVGILGVGPFYALWAYLTVGAITGAYYDARAAAIGGAFCVVVGCAVALLFVVIASRSPRSPISQLPAPSSVAGP